MAVPCCVSQTVAAGPCSATGTDGERRHEVGRLQHDEPHFVGRFVVQQECQVVERDDRVQLIGQHLEQLGHGFVAGKRLRDAQQRVVAREVSRGELRLRLP